jgi:uncharacterized protein YjbI with pentapeptide repeats
MLKRVLVVSALLTASCSAAPATTAVTTSTTLPTTTVPAVTSSALAGATTTSTTSAPSSWPVAAGALWEVDRLAELGIPATGSQRWLSDVESVAGGLVAVGRDNGEPLIIYSSDGGASWESAEVEAPHGAESVGLAAVAEHDGVLVAVGSRSYGCPGPPAPCDDFIATVWRSTDGGRTWAVVNTPTMSLGPESSIVDIVAGPDGFVAIGNINGPAPDSSLLWTSVDGLTWSAGIPLPATAGGFVRANQLAVSGDTVVVTGDEVLCGHWFDNGFWVIAAGFVEQARAWTFWGGALTRIDMGAAGIEQPPVPECPESGSLLEDPHQYWSWFGDIGVHHGRPTIVASGRLAMVGSDGTVETEPLDLLDGESVRFVGGSNTLIAIREGERQILWARSWVDGVLQEGGPPIAAGGEATLGELVAVGDEIVGVGTVTTGVTEAILWRSGPGSVGEQAELTCDPAPGADCRGVDLREQDLSNRDLSGIDLRHADLTLSDLSGSNLSGALLGSADMSAINLRNADLTGANLAGVDLGSYIDDPLVIARADFTGADLRGASIDLAETATFDSVLADGAYFHVSGVVANVTFRNASMLRTYITAAYDADMASLVADFSGAAMDMAYVGADMTGSTFAGVASSDVLFADDAVCPDGTAPVAVAYGINRCAWGG